MKLHNLHYPWVSALTSIIVVSYLYCATQPDIIAYYQIPTDIFHTPIPSTVVVLLFLTLVLDARKFYIKSSSYSLKVKQLNEQINELLIAKKQLQHKAHTFSGHADKLKLFISDRLLEYIEYDEKFLHFKSIASEVRHNGVICFDKVQTALRLAISRCDTNDSKSYSDALNSMIYLWDLLELSTTDNLALHISNQLCECEEHYYQALLKDDGLSDDLSAPTFTAHTALQSAIEPFFEQSLDVDTNAEAHLPINARDATFYLHIESEQTLLGNQNHIVLLLENLINNAMFYSNKKPYNRNKDARIAVAVRNHNNNVRYSIYNHGPHINEQDKEQIFQLGYSTRRVREHNGKGLGLYFVNEIVKGYEGTITFTNICNREDVYSIRIAFDDDSVLTHVVETQIVENKVQCHLPNSDGLSQTAQWSTDQRVVSVEVSTQASGHTFAFHPNNEQKGRFLDPADPSMPQWAVDVVQRKRSTKIIFTPLNVSGVRFTVDLPSAQSRLDYSDSFDDYADTGKQNLDAMRKHFIDPDTLSNEYP